MDDTQDPTTESTGPAVSGESSREFPMQQPEVIDRYRIIRSLGQGGFGRVYLAHDVDIDRYVSIKVPNPARISRPEDVKAFLAEARILGQLDHPHVVPVYDVGTTGETLCYVVSKYIEGSDLAARIKERALDFQESAELAAVVAEALHHAHTRGLVHRDVKPANILIDASGKPYVADFGLALKDEDFGRGAGFAGTPAYMSPEQARGEGHRVDGRSDIFSLGVVVYELLSGRRPFRGETREQVLDQIVSAEVRPPRQIDDTIPKELERICLKALSRRVTDRYNTAKDMAEDLRLYLQSASPTISPVPTLIAMAVAPGSSAEGQPVPPMSTQTDSALRPVKIVPKGLRSFDEHDASFFLELLPGPRDRDGLPESIRFWKTRIEENDAEKTFRVGLIYGPSGCGKSSLVRAGLLPRLGKQVVPVYVEATGDDTEGRLLRAIRKACPGLAPNGDLAGSLAIVRRGRSLPSSQKLLLVIDQFEQWLHARRVEDNTELVAALRHCDGENLQALILVRDDFWLAVSRFMADLEVELRQGQNIFLVDLFDRRHAHKVLRAFGQAYGTLPEQGALTPDQDAFLDRALEGLAQENEVISVRLTLFAEMVKGMPWTPATLRAVGGTEGVGVTFLEETFSSPQANPRHRLHQKGARAVLMDLLPESRSDIKGRTRSETALQEASGYADRPRDFAELIHILDAELRLLTPTDPEGKDEGEWIKDEGSLPKSDRDVSSSFFIFHPLSLRHYQLTHDYLVSSLRDWLTRKQRQTGRGRAELRLTERSVSWNAKPENRQLPTGLEWANIWLSTKRNAWTEPQRKMMKRAGRVYASRGLLASILTTMAVWGGIEGFGTLRATNLVEQLRITSTSGAPAVIEQLRSYSRWARRPLAGLLSSADNASEEYLRASLATLAMWPSDGQQAAYLRERLLTASPIELPVIAGTLWKNDPGSESRLWSLLYDQKLDPDKRFRAACALANSDSAPGEKRWDAVSPIVADRFLAAVIKNSGDYSVLMKTLAPLREQLLTPLASIFRDKGRSESERDFATRILVDLAAEDPERLADLLMTAETKAYRRLFLVVERHAARTVPLFQAELSRRLSTSESVSEIAKDELAERQARAAIALIRMGRAFEVWPRLAHSPDPRLRSYIINWLSLLGADPAIIAAELCRRLGSGSGGQRAPVPARSSTAIRPASASDADLFHTETSIRRALILVLGTYGTIGLSPAERDPLIARLLDLYQNDRDAGVHGAAEWALRQWKQEDKLKAAQTEFIELEDNAPRRWLVNSQGQTFAVIDGPVAFRMGSPPNEPERDTDETSRDRVIPRRFAIGDKEVTVEQYQKFVADGNMQFGLAKSSLNKYSPDPNGPMISVSWFGAVAYCNWLSKREGLPPDQWCYLPNEKKEYDAGMKIPGDALRRNGYRLPAEAEWEYASRAGTVTSRYHGVSIDLLGAYARYDANSNQHAWPTGSLLPNDLGLFDMLGNAFEWCQERQESNTAVHIESTNDELIDIRDARLLRGGAFYYPSGIVRSAQRSLGAPTGRDTDGGFRLARTFP